MWLRVRSDPPVSSEARWKRRNRRQHLKRAARKGVGMNPGSIKTHHFHHKYPMSLRALGHFVCDPPSVNQQHLVNDLHRLSGELQGYLKQIGILLRPQAHDKPSRCLHCVAPRQKGGPNQTNCRQGGGNPLYDTPGQPHHAAHCAVSGRKGGMNHKKGSKGGCGSPLYRPVPASGVHNMGNSNFTCKQVGAARKIQAHVNMARVNNWNNSAESSFDLASCFKMVLQAPARFRNALKKESTFSVIWDSGASISISPDCDDFVGPMSSACIGMRLKGIVKGLSIQGQEYILWAVLDTSGQVKALKVPAYYMPQARVRLLSTTSLLQTYPDEKINMESHRLALSGLEGTQGRGLVVALVNPINNLPMTTSYRYSDIGDAPQALNSIITTVSSENMNLSEAQKELVHWHNRLGHVGYKRVQSLMRSGALAHSEATRRLHTAACKLTDLPKCAACQFGKQK
jgi:hypothetical protein